MKSSATNLKISWFKKEDNADNLDLSPQFQRRSVWSDEQCSYLIDTILNKLPIPEIYFRSSSSPDGSTKYEIVDGQQRIRSILRFGSNDLELVGDEVGAKWLNKSFENLSDSAKIGFWDYEIVARDVSGASDIEIRDLFKRLNIHSVVLNDQELRHAQYSGKFLKTVENLADNDWWIKNKIVNLRQVRRMEDVEFVSELLVGIVAGPQDKKKTLDEYYQNYERSMPDQMNWTKKFEDTINLIDQVISKDDLYDWSGKSDFYTLFLVFSALSDKRITTSQRTAISTELRHFRKQVDQAKRKDNVKTFPKDVHAYAEAVTRAATDLGRRETRLRVLEGRIANALSAASKRS